MARSGLGRPVPEAVAGQMGSFISRGRFGVQWVLGGWGPLCFAKNGHSNLCLPTCFLTR